MRCARHVTPETPVPVFSRWYVCLTVLFASALLIGPLWTRVRRTSVIESFQIQAGSMRETILPDERLFAVKWTYGWRDPLWARVRFGERKPQRGDLAVFRFPEDRSRLFIKRVVALSGETVAIRDKTVLVDGRPLREPYAVFLNIAPPPSAEVPEPARRDFGPIRVRPARYFVLGDSRDNSRDSRFFGDVPEGDFLGRAAVVYWSWDPVAGRVRWGRIGKRLE